MNIQKELLEILFTEGLMIKCAILNTMICGDYDDDKPCSEETFSLRKNHTSEEYIEFMDSLDIEYDKYGGGQELYGTVWLSNGTWLTRGEYDGNEWWERHVLPEIPIDLI